MDNSDIQITDVQQKCHLHAGYENLHTQLVTRQKYILHFEFICAYKQNKMYQNVNYIK